MKAVVQRVKNASVEIDGKIYSSINQGMLVLFCVEKDDTEDKIDWMAKKMLSMRIFEDENDKMNFSVEDIKGEILVVSQFTLAADCKKEQDRVLIMLKNRRLPEKCMKNLLIS